MLEEGLEERSSLLERDLAAQAVPLSLPVEEAAAMAASAGEVEEEEEGMWWSGSEEEEYVEEEEEQEFEPEPEEPEPEPLSKFAEEEEQFRVFDPGGAVVCVSGGVCLV